MEDVNKKGFNFTVLFIVMFAIASIIVLVLIWWPKSATKKRKIISYTSVNGQNESLNLYLTSLKSLLTIDNSDKLFEKMNSDFLKKYNLTKDNFKQYMDTNKFISKNPILKSSTVSKQDDDVYIYRVEYLTYGGLKRYVNIIETKPYEYTISFEQDTIPIASNKSSSDTKDGVIYSVTKDEIRDNSITYKLTVTNKGDKTIKYNFDNIDNVYIVLTDNTQIKLGASIVSSDEDILTPNSVITKKFFFAIGTDYHENIKSLVLSNVEVDGESKEVTINLK